MHDLDHRAIHPRKQHLKDINRDPTAEEIAEHERFMALSKVTVKDLEQFFSVYASGHKLRTRSHMNVSVGGHYAPLGGPKIKTKLQQILGIMDQVGTHATHVSFELLNPFSDGNGRSGRMLWLRQMRSTPYGFLRHFYYQTLSASRE